VLTCAGLAVGAVAGLLTTRLARAVLPGVRPTDPATFAATAGLLAAVVALACLVPARQAGRIDPIEALRAE
jgi:putative ABC transport system permease protein